MNILISGATGLVGRRLTRALAAAGHRTLCLGRGPGADVRWQPEAGQVDLKSAGPLDAVIHLAGETIAQRWTAAAKARIRDSRVKGTRLLAEELARLPKPPATLLCASATGFYGNRGDEWLDEESAPGQGFLAEVGQAWEAAAAPAMAAGIRVVHLRLGLVLTPEGGALRRMLPVFRLGVAGRLGDGGHWWSWIAMEDLVAVFRHALDTPTLRGPVNAVSPAPVTNREFTRVLGAVLRRPNVLPIPAALVKLIFGQMGREALLSSVRVRPRRLLESGFQFRFPELEPALRNMLQRA